MTSELRPTRGKVKDPTAAMHEGKDPDTGPPLNSDKELAQMAKEIFEEDLADPEAVQADIDAMYGATQSAIQPGLHARLAKIVHALPDVSPEGTNKFFNYKFISDKQVLGLLRPRLSAESIVIYPETVQEGGYIELTTKAGATSRMTRMLVTFRVVDGITGETFSGQALGYGDDAGDKGANKAYTAAFKNFLIKLFMIGGESDLEDDEETDKRAADQASGRPINISAGKGVTGVQQGGRQTQITEPQLDAIESEVKRLGITFAQFQTAVKAVTGEDIETSSGLQKLTFKEAANLLQALMAASPPEGGTDDAVEADRS